MPSRITYAFRRCVARKPTAAEVDVLSSLLKRQAERFAGRRGRPWRPAAADPSTGRSSGDVRPPARGWTAVARVLLNLDETITKE